MVIRREKASERAIVINDFKPTIVGTPDEALSKRMSRGLNVGLFVMMRSAMVQSGGEATSGELIEVIRSMPCFNTLSRKGCSSSKGGKRLLWEQSVGRNMGSLFEPVLDERGRQMKRGKLLLKVWKAETAHSTQTVNQRRKIHYGHDDTHEDRGDFLAQ